MPSKNHGKNTTYPVPSFSPFSLHVYSPRLRGLQPEKEKTEHKTATESHGLCGWDQNSDTYPHTLPILLFPCSAAAILSSSLGIRRHKTYKTYMTDCSPSQCVLFAHQFQPWLQGSAWHRELATSRDSPTSQAEVVLAPKFAATAERVGMAVY